jgi:hypothetical protein
MSEEENDGVGSIVFGVVLIAIGAVITGATYSAAEDGGSYVVTGGLFFFGAIQVLVGIFRFIGSAVRK